MTDNQKAVLNYLNNRRGAPISPTEIGREVGGGDRHSSWASPICKKLVEMGYAERTERGWYLVTSRGSCILMAG